MISERLALALLIGFVVLLMALTAECQYCRRPIFRRRNRVCSNCEPIARQLERAMRERDTSAS